MASIEINGYSVDEISKAFGALAVGAYVTGYLILSYHLSNFGFNPVSPFRPRVLETGVCALLFFAIPMLVAETLTAIPSRGLSSMTIFTMRALSLPVICYFSISLPGFLDDLPKSSPIHRDSHGTALDKALLITIALISILVLAAALIRWMWRSYHKKQVACICVLIALDIFFVRLEFTSMNSPVTKRTFLWFLLISFVSLGLIGGSRDSVAKKKRKDQIEECQLQIRKSTEIIKLIELEIDPLTAGTYESVEPSADYDLKEMLSQAKTNRLRLENALAQFRSDVSVWHLGDFSLNMLSS